MTTGPTAMTATPLNRSSSERPVASRLQSRAIAPSPRSSDGSQHISIQSRNRVAPTQNGETRTLVFSRTVMHIVGKRSSAPKS
jgi:hypothetical protein